MQEKLTCFIHVENIFRFDCLKNIKHHRKTNILFFLIVD